MAITVQALVSELQAFFRNIDLQASSGALGNIPLLSGAVLPPGARVFAALEDQFLSALSGTPDDPDAIAAALRSVAGEIGGVTECIEGAHISLEKNGAKIADALSDAYGDFRFAGLEEASGAYKVRIADGRFAPKTLEVALGKSAVLGDIVLDKRPAVGAG